MYCYAPEHAKTETTAGRALFMVWFSRNAYNRQQELLSHCPLKKNPELVRLVLTRTPLSQSHTPCTPPPLPNLEHEPLRARILQCAGADSRNCFQKDLYSETVPQEGRQVSALVTRDLDISFLASRRAAGYTWQLRRRQLKRHDKDQKKNPQNKMHGRM